MPAIGQPNSKNSLPVGRRVKHQWCDAAQGPCRNDLHGPTSPVFLNTSAAACHTNAWDATANILAGTDIDAAIHALLIKQQYNGATNRARAWP